MLLYIILAMRGPGLEGDGFVDGSVEVTGGRASGLPPGHHGTGSQLFDLDIHFRGEHNDRTTPAGFRTKIRPRASVGWGLVSA